ncbi:glycosyltransferase family 1 protein [Caproicibacterium sp. XB2]|uniref:glycosyltransferase family 1 protein n=1 Tax=Caproicibacterium sp. XB2 TaxID=3388458 RepID=UPI00385160B1
MAQVMGRMMAGGVESVVMNYYRHMDHKKVQFDFIVNNDSTVIPYDEISSLGGHVYEIPSYKHIFRYTKALKILFQKNHYPIVHSNMNSLSLFPLYAAKKANVPVRIAHSHSTSSPGETKKNILKNILRSFSKVYPTHYCACSTHAANWLFGEDFCKTNPIRIVKNAIDPDDFTYNPDIRKQKRNELGITDQFVVGHAGRMCFQKNQTFLLDVFARVLEYHPRSLLLLVGDGDMRPQIEQKTNELGITDKVIFTGVRKDVNELYQAMDVFAFPSNYEGLGLVAVEAQAAGLPVVASEKVPAEAKICETMEYCPLQETTERWAQRLLVHSNDIRKDRRKDVSASGYDIHCEAKKLQDFYLSL